MSPEKRGGTKIKKEGRGGLGAGAGARKNRGQRSKNIPSVEER